MKISRFQMGFRDFYEDFKISMKISRFQLGFWDFYEDFKISDGISRFKWDFTEISSVISLERVVYRSNATIYRVCDQIQDFKSKISRQISGFQARFRDF